MYYDICGPKFKPTKIPNKRFYEFESGTIAIDGTSIRDYKLAALRNHVAVVLQDVFLFADQEDFLLSRRSSQASCGCPGLDLRRILKLPVRKCKT